MHCYFIVSTLQFLKGFQKGVVVLPFPPEPPTLFRPLLFAFDSTSRELRAYVRANDGYISMCCFKQTRFSMVLETHLSIQPWPLMDGYMTILEPWILCLVYSLHFRLRKYVTLTRFFKQCTYSSNVQPNFWVAQKTHGNAPWMQLIHAVIFCTPTLGNSHERIKLISHDHLERPSSYSWARLPIQRSSIIQNCSCNFKGES